MIINRIWAMPNKWTFEINPIKQIINKYLTNNGKNWIDPFCGMSKIAEFRNDLNSDFEDCQHKYALDFVNDLQGIYDGVLFDPPYSGRQVKECYTNLNKQVHRDDTNAYFYGAIKRALSSKIKKHGLVISCGWNSNGFGIKNGFEIIEVLLVAHGSAHNDTIVTVERKIK